jgi:thymidylate synthase (FAD)
MRVELISHTADPARLCGEAAAVCTNSVKPESSLRHSVEAGHESVLEHAVFTFRVEGLSRAALAQLTRHRLASFDVQSQRYVRIHGVDLVMPETIRSSDFYVEAGSLMKDVMNLYQRMVDAGIPAEDARYITPQAVPTVLVMTMNARELRHFFSLRCCNRAQWEIRHLADEMLTICRQVAPELFEGAGPGCVAGYCKEKKPCGHPRERGEWDEE